MHEYFAVLIKYYVRACSCSFNINSTLIIKIQTGAILEYK